MWVLTAEVNGIPHFRLRPMVSQAATLQSSDWATDNAKRLQRCLVKEPNVRFQRLCIANADTELSRQKCLTIPALS